MLIGIQRQYYSLKTVFSLYSMKIICRSEWNQNMDFSPPELIKSLLVCDGKVGRWVEGWEDLKSLLPLPFQEIPLTTRNTAKSRAQTASLTPALSLVTDSVSQLLCRLKWTGMMSQQTGQQWKCEKLSSGSLFK